MVPRAVLIGGSTASGKSALALAVARRSGAVIINADSQQLFADLPTLTARPTAADLAHAPHELYGRLAADQQPSVGVWLALIAPLLRELAAADRPALLVGGTGLYLHALRHGLPPLPAVAPELRRDLAAATADQPTQELHQRLAGVDPVMAARLRPSDRQRILRALEVIEATGRSLADWQAAPPAPALLPRMNDAVALVPAAEIVAERAAGRLERMLAGGAVDEVAGLASARPDLLGLPIAKVHGVRDILAMLAGRQTAVETAERIAAQVRQYAKRQRTFLRHQLSELRPIAATGEAALVAGLADELACALGEASGAAKNERAPPSRAHPPGT